MERLAGAPGAGQGAQQDGGGSQRNQPVWERPWSLEEIRNSSESWSLAADAGLLNFLQEFSQQTISKTHEIEKQLDGLIRDTKTTNCRLHNVFNDFLMLSNTQFIENRVYDEDIAEPVPKSEVGDKPEQEKTREQKEAELIPKVQEAVNFGLQVLESAFEQLDIKAGNSDSEEEEINERVDPILEPKDLYIDRPLPYIIGSKLFMEQEDVGLGDFSSEEGSIDSDRASGVDSEDEQDERESDDNSDNRFEEQRLQTVLSDEDDDDGSNLFDSEKEEDEDIIEENAKSEKRPRPTSFADELAARIKGDTPNKPNEEQESLSSVESIPKKQVKGKKETRTVPSDDDDDDDDMFKPPKLTDEDFSPFGTQGGLFSGGRGLFDDEEDLFVEVPRPKKEKEIKIKTPVTEEPSPSNPVRKVPVGGVSLFPGADPMFNPSSVLAEKDKSKTVTPKTETAPKLPTPSSGLFDDDDDDFFVKPNMKPSNAGKSAATAFVQEGDAELFSEKPVLPPPTQSNATTQSQAVKEKIGKKTPSPEEPKTLPQPSLKTQTKGLFSDEEDAEDLFLPSTNVTKSKASPLPASKPSKALSLFDDEEEDSLFSTAPVKTQITIKTPQDKIKAEEPIKTGGSSLFSSDEEDNWNRAKTVKPIPEQTKKDNITKPSQPKDQTEKVEKKASLFDWDSAKTTKPISEQMQKDNITKPSQPKDQTEKVEKKASLFDWDSAKTTKPISEQTQKDNITKPSQPKDQTEKVEKKASLFDWDSAKTTKPISEQTQKDNITKPSQPKDQTEKVEKKASLFDWDSAKTTKPISEQTQKDNITKPSQPKDQTEKVEKKASLFDWDSAKTTKPISEQTQKDNITKPSQPKDQTEKVEKKASLFDWDSAKTTKPISEQTQKDNITKPSQPKDQIEKVEKKASLFDDEEDDLFAITKKDSTKKSQRASLLFEEEATNDVTLFPAVPASSPPSLPSLEKVKSEPLSTLSFKETKDVLVPKTERKSPEVKTEAEKKPEDSEVLGKLDIFVEPKKEKVDRPVSTIPDDDEDDDDLFLRLPPPDVEDKKVKKNVLSLFDEDDDDDNFEDLPVNRTLKKEIKMPSEEHHHSKSTGVFQDEELLFSHKLQMDNDPDVDLFANAKKPASEKSSKLSSGAGLFGDEDEDDLFATTKPKPPPMTPEKKMGSKKDSTDRPKDINKLPQRQDVSEAAALQSSGGRQEKLEQKPADPGPIKTKDPDSRIGKLQANLTINPATLLPGAAFKAPAAKPTSSAVGVASQRHGGEASDTGSSAKSKKERVGVSFDHPANVSTLHSANKDRIKVAGKRRPPSRAGRRLASQDSGETEEVTAAAPAHLPFAVDSTAISDTKWSQTEEPKANRYKAERAVKDIVVPPSSFSSDISSEKSARISEKVSPSDLPDIFHSDDLFAKSVESKTTVGRKSKEKSNEGLVKKHRKAEKKSSLPVVDDQGSDDDLFQSTKPKSTKTSTQPSVFGKHGEEDLFADQKITQKKEAKTTSGRDPKQQIPNIFEDDIFASEAVQPAKKVKEKEKRGDIFDDDDMDIFADLTVKPKEKKTNKKVEPKSIFDDDMDDIFASGNKMKTSKSQTEKSALEAKSERKGSFDDPLNAFGGP